ncbi:MAG: aldo/keto reductase [candidate division Zixibacteria bacterium]|nr:aldo/keto reductase [candidate division Zixibacteria bacterium]
MNYRKLGTTGVKLSVIGLGTNRFGSDAVSGPEVERILDAAVDHGINFIDTANIYTGGLSEETIGKALKGRWGRFVVATKFCMATGDGPNDRGASRYHIQNAVDASLRRLAHDCIDLYYIHRWDPDTPIEETLETLDDLIRSGKVRYIGASALAAWQMAKSNLLAEMRGWTAFVALQSHYNMLERDVEREVLPYCASEGVGFVPYYPLAGGFLTGKYKRGNPPPPGSRGETNKNVQQYMTDTGYGIVERLSTYAADRNRAINELAQAWLLARPAVCSVISGITSVAQLEHNARAGDWTLTPHETEEIDTLLKGQP